jgi:hypothetical protein
MVRLGALVRSRRAIRSITFTPAAFGGSATIPLATRFARMKNQFFLRLSYFIFHIFGAVSRIAQRKTKNEINAVAPA